MSDLPEEPQRNEDLPSENSSAVPEQPPSAEAPTHVPPEVSTGVATSVPTDIWTEAASHDIPPQPFPEATAPQYSVPASELPLFHSFTLPPLRPPERIPNFGHVLLLIPMVIAGFIAGLIFFIGGVHVHLFGATTLTQAGTDIHYILGFEGILYVTAFIASLLFFPMVWHESLFEGLQWNGATAKRLSRRLVAAAFLCFVLAWLVGYLVPSPENTPIEKIFKTPGAAWLLFFFGISLAPFFEEMFFRGFLLPSLCTAYDWMAEKITRQPPRPLGEHGQPEWSRAAMIVASIATSLPFAAMHGEQTGYSFGPFLLLVGVSLVLCGVRLTTRSLASSTLVHSCYNLLLFSLMLIGTGGFRHLDKM
jgi:membrane protease YdiL (CAAX protease family)